MNRTTSLFCNSSKVTQFIFCTIIASVMLVGICESYGAVNQWTVDGVVNTSAGNANNNIITTDPAAGTMYQPMNTGMGNDTLTFGVNASNQAADVGDVFIRFGENGIAFIDGNINATDAGDGGISAAGNLNVTVGATGSVAANNAGIISLGNLTVNNFNEITSVNFYAISIGNAVNTMNVTNNIGATISSTNFNAIYTGINTTASIINYGEIIAPTARGIYARNNLTLSNHSDATISGLNNGVYVEGLANVLNEGTITGTFGLFAWNLILINAADAAIIGTSSVGNGVSSLGNGIITNDGIISGGDGISVFQLNLTNNPIGVITGTNRDGVVAGNGAIVTNHGIIETGINGVGGDDGIDVNNGADIINTGTIRGGNNGIEAGNNLILTNATGGAITGTTGDGVFAGNFTVVAATPDITNNGEITGGDDGIEVGSGADILNTGDIIGSDEGIIATGDDLTVVNDDTLATITGTNGNGIEAIMDANITNRGIIHGGLNGIFAPAGTFVLINEQNATITGDILDGVFVGNGANITNSGEITGNDDGIDALNNLTVINHISGEITGTNGDGIEANNFANVTNSGEIIGGQDGVGVGNNLMLINNVNATITGAADGVSAGITATITNSGTITGVDDGIDVTNGATITNNGEITGTGATSTGIESGNTTTITNNMGGEISGTGHGIVSGTGLVLTNECGAVIHAINQQAVLAGGGNIINRGDITTDSATAAAITFGAGNDTIIHESGTISSNYVNAVEMGDGDDTFTLQATVQSIQSCGIPVVNGIIHGGAAGETNGDTFVIGLIGFCADEWLAMGESGTIMWWGTEISWEDFENKQFTGISFGQWGETPDQIEIGNTLDCIVEKPEGHLIDFIFDIANAGEENFPEIANQLSPRRMSEAFSKVAFNKSDFWMQRMTNRASLMWEQSGQMINTSQLTLLDNTLGKEFQQMTTTLAATKNMRTGDVKRATAPQADFSQNDNRFGLFLAGTASMAEGDGNRDIYDYEWNTYGVVVGADYKLFPFLAVGIVGGYDHTDLEVDPYGSDADIETYTVGTYLNARYKNLYANALFTFNYDQYNGERNLSYFDASHDFDTDGHHFTMGLGAGYDFQIGQLTIGPTANIRYVDYNIDGYSESGNGIHKLRILDDNAESLRTSLGAKATYTLTAGSLAITPELRAAWGHEFRDDSRGVTAHFNSDQLRAFTVHTTDPERDWAELGASLRAKFGETFSLFVDYDNQIGRANFDAHAVQGGVRLDF